MELVKITEFVYYIPNPANIGVVKDGGKSAIIIDSGLDDSTGKKILRLLEGTSLSPKAIINTHSHADHCGGNRLIRERTSAKIYAPEFESAIIQYPLLEPFYLFSGAYPPKNLQNKFLMAHPSTIDHVIKTNETKIRFDEIELEIVSLPGHAPNQIGVAVEDVLFCADSLFSEEVLAKHKIPFFSNIDKTRESLLFLKASQYKFYVPAHAQPREAITKLVDANLEVIDRIEEIILEIAREKKTKELILKELCDRLQLEMRNAQQYYLMNTAVMAYLSFLQDSGKLNVEVSSNALYWYC